ncbi:RNI-like protein [Basidiobolus meristosporus CBS 931.73]|uniref:RNI-like protein n=1 Tax=Basidiobolus meristosporus CBS 931.73 TaxID=1314790 RepID=A0A1Y1YTV0_9FUNG|nr:RNI-like protein [Basidiobolus meristosporus CBS 931.73]|eukprot:ORY01462.1 RNI-like protein [Basidiobolus meristosporus CBS 931.73]
MASISSILSANSSLSLHSSGNSNHERASTASRRYASLVRTIDFTQLDEVYRNSTTLSQYLVRLIPIVRTNLQRLDLGFSKGVKNFDLQRLAPWLSNLTSLNLAGGGRTDIVLTKLSKHCPKLTHLSVSWNSQLTDFGFVEMARNCRELRALDLTNCAQISDTGIMALAVYCTRLKVLNISYCQCVGEVAVWELVRSCKELKLINALGCIHLSRGFPDQLKARYPELLVNVPGVLPFYYPDVS